MLWLVWRQHRAQALITAGLLLALGLVLLVLGLGNADIVDRLASNPSALERALAERYGWVGGAFTWLLPSVAPAAIGLFWGAPVLGRELERGTHRLAWTQSVSPRRWLAMKLGVLATAVVLTGLALGIMINAWLSSFGDTRYSFRFGNQGIFAATGLAPAAWCLFSFMIGVAAGAVFGRIMRAMAATLAVMVIALSIVPGIRQLYAPAERIELEFTSLQKDALAEDSMFARRDIIDASGRVITDNSELDRIFCSPADPACTPPPGIRQIVYYHPPSRYWRFQWTEAALLLAASFALGALAVRRTARSRI